MPESRREDEERVLAIDPTSRGFGYAVLEGPGRLVDWGTKDVGHADDPASLAHVEALLRHYLPDGVIVEDTRDASSRRRKRPRVLIEMILKLAESYGARGVRIARQDVMKLFATGTTLNKRALATLIAGHFPELEPRIPPVRKAWMSEDLRTSIFDAVAFALVYFFQSDDRKRSE